MYRTLQDFLTDWEYESAMTLKVFEHISDESLSLKPYDDVRSMTRLCWHITETLKEMPGHAGLTIEGAADDQHPASIAAIIDTYARSSASIVKELTAHWSDAQLTDMVNMYGEEWSKGTVLAILVRHQSHHRGQLTILMRQAGLKVPGVYGPSKEEWVGMGMNPME
jgi:uncharacterized damage-inducible protein DinB